MMSDLSALSLRWVLLLTAGCDQQDSVSACKLLSVCEHARAYSTVNVLGYKAYAQVS